MDKALHAVSRINEENLNLISEIMLLENEQRNVFRQLEKKNEKETKHPNKSGPVA